MILYNIVNNEFLFLDKISTQKDRYLLAQEVGVSAGVRVGSVHSMQIVVLSSVTPHVAQSEIIAWQATTHTHTHTLAINSILCSQHSWHLQRNGTFICKSQLSIESVVC